MASITPMMQQYLDIKVQYKDCLLFFRLGDFYEMFFDDAQTASRELEITLTGRDCGLEERAPMCGVPFHSVDNYIARLITKGYKVAICEQVEDPAAAKGIVKRDVVRIVTPGTVTDSSMLDEKKNNYLVSIYKEGISYGIASVDISTGEMSAAQILGGDTDSKLKDELARLSPSEVIANSLFAEDSEYIKTLVDRFNFYLSPYDDACFTYPAAKEKLQSTFGTVNGEGLSVNAAGALLAYLERTQKADLSHIRTFQQYTLDAYMVLDFASRRNLELTENLREKTKKGTLLWVLDRTVTSMGGRMLRKWIHQPLLELSGINERLEAVNEFKEKFMLRMEVRELLRKVYDMERLMGKIVLASANARDLLSLKTSIGQLPYIKELLAGCTAVMNVQSNRQTDTLADIYALIDRGITEEPPVSLREGGLIKKGYHAEVDRLKEASTEGKGWIAALEAAEREKTGIRTLKVGYNRVFGYYIEITKSYYEQIPENYIRKQTLSNCERFITQELKEIEDTVLGAEEKVIELEYRLFIELRDKIATEIGRIKRTAESVAGIDVLCSLAEVADRENYCMPQMTVGNEIEITEGRHPVVEKMMSHENFVPNDTLLDIDENRLAIITGPNMAGKSTYMRQVALIVLMAQIGSFIPARSAKIGIVDRIFTRVGASDDLASGQSTFMVEMSEMAAILNNATQRSLLILDEIGRGTSTFDGLSIAWAVVEFISDRETLGCRTLFATHYHELTELEGKLTGVKNYCIAVKKKGEEIIFLRKIIRGGADESYGIEVARLAGVPLAVIERSRELLSELEAADISKKGLRLRKGRVPLEGQMDIFTMASSSSQVSVEITQELRRLDITALTPLEALNIISRLQAKAREGK